MQPCFCMIKSAENDELCGGVLMKKRFVKNINQPSLKKMIENECANNERFKRGRNLVIILVLIYLAIRFSDLIIPTLLTGISYEVNIEVVSSLLIAILIGYLGIIGSVKLMSFLCFLTPVANTWMMFSVAQGYAGGFIEMMRAAPVSWYVLTSSIICVIIGILLLANNNVQYFGKRRLELQKEYAEMIKERAFIYENEVAKSEIQTVNAVTTEEIIETDTNLHIITEKYNLDEFEGEHSPLRACSIPSAISKVNKKRIFDLHRDLVCKKYKCIDSEVDTETYILTFAGNKKALIKWIPEEKSIYIESGTNSFDEEFHELMLDVIEYLGKNMGSKFEITDQFVANR